MRIEIENVKDGYHIYVIDPNGTRSGPWLKSVKGDGAGFINLTVEKTATLHAQMQETGEKSVEIEDLPLPRKLREAIHRLKPESG